MSRGAGLQWGKAWYFVMAFIALLVGGWVAAKLSANTYGSGRLHGAVTWGLTTLATFMIAAWLFWGALSAGIAAVRTATVATNTTTSSPAASQVAQNKAQQLQNQAANTVNRVERYAPSELHMVKGDASTLFLVIFGGIVCGIVGALIGGGRGGVVRGIRPAVGRAPTPMERAS